MRIGGRVVPGLVGDVHVPEDRDVCDRVAVGDQEAPRLQVPIEQGEHLLAGLPPTLGVRIPRHEPSGREPKAQASRRGDDLGLLVHEPADHLRPLERVVGPERTAVGEVDEHRGRFQYDPPVGKLEDGRGPRRIQHAELVGQGLAGEDVDRHALVARAELGEQQSHLETVRRGGVVVQLESQAGDRSSRVQ